jgi:hypothetical protein
MTRKRRSDNTMARRRTDNTMARRRRIDNGQKKKDKILHRKLKLEQLETQ